MSHALRTAVKALVFAAAFLPHATPTAAQLTQCEGALGTTRSVRDTTVLTVRLPHALTNRDISQGGGPDRWVLVDISTPMPERPLRVVGVQLDPPDLSQPVADLILTLNRPLEPTHEYRLFAPFLTYQGCKPEAVPEGKVTIRDPAAVNPATGRPIPPDTDFFRKSPSKGRDDSNVYLSGNLEGAKGGSPNFSADIKLESPYDTAGFFQELGPYFNLRASTTDAADANSLDFGLKLRHAFDFPVRLKPGTTELAEKQPLLNGIVWNLTPGFESDRRFDNVNVIVGNRFVFVPRVFGNTNRVYFQPFVGFEVGRNLNSPVEEAEGLSIFRGTTGGSLYLNLMPRADKQLSFQVDYIRRFLLRRETSFTEDGDKKLVPLAVGRGPRDHLELKLEYGFTDFLSTALSYEYGRLPPNFQLVNHEYGFGLIYKFKTKFPK